ncbi:MAG TPA: triose-phosphate isomerase, partial [Smithella sp.]|nr:triose-phosphate isomerase [Smithella sp.]
MRKWIVAGNWKMHNTVAESIALAKAIKEGAAGLQGGTVVLAPPFTALASVHQVIQGSPVCLAAGAEELGGCRGE